MSDAFHCQGFTVWIAESSWLALLSLLFTSSVVIAFLVLELVPSEIFSLSPISFSQCPYVLSLLPFFSLIHSSGVSCRPYFTGFWTFIHIEDLWYVRVHVCVWVCAWVHVPIDECRCTYVQIHMHVPCFGGRVSHGLIWNLPIKTRLDG